MALIERRGGHRGLRGLPVPHPSVVVADALAEFAILCWPGEGAPATSSGWRRRRRHVFDRGCPRSARAARPAAGPESTLAGPADRIGSIHPEWSPCFECLLPPPSGPPDPPSPPPPHKPASARAGAPPAGDTNGLHDAAPPLLSPAPPPSVAANAAAAADERAAADAPALGARLLTQPRARAASTFGGAPPAHDSPPPGVCLWRRRLPSPPCLSPRRRRRPLGPSPTQRPTTAGQPTASVWARCCRSPSSRRQRRGRKRALRRHCRVVLCGLRRQSSRRLPRRLRRGRAFPTRPPTRASAAGGRLGHRWAGCCWRRCGATTFSARCADADGTSCMATLAATAPPLPSPTLLTPAAPPPRPPSQRSTRVGASRRTQPLQPVPLTKPPARRQQPPPLAADLAPGGAAVATCASFLARPRRGIGCHVTIGANGATPTATRAASRFSVAGFPPGATAQAFILPLPACGGADASGDRGRRAWPVAAM